MIRFKTFAVISLFLFACSSSKLLAPTQVNVDKLSDEYPSLTLEELIEGKTLYEAKCSTCHPAKNPTKRTKAEWKEVVPRMKAKANKKEEKISSKDEELILKYLLSVS